MYFRKLKNSILVFLIFLLCFFRIFSSTAQNDDDEPNTRITYDSQFLTIYVDKSSSYALYLWDLRIVGLAPPTHEQTEPYDLIDIFQSDYRLQPELEFVPGSCLIIFDASLGTDPPDAPDFCLDDEVIRRPSANFWYSDEDGFLPIIFEKDGMEEVCRGGNINCSIYFAPRDSDNDAVPDQVDECDDQLGSLDSNGCPSNRDGDLYIDTEDDCPDDPGTSTFNLIGCPDEDGDTVADIEDDCPNYSNDEIGNPCNPDEDGDGIDDIVDSCPHIRNDSIGDPCNPDEDNDGVLDTADDCPNVSGTSTFNLRGCLDTDDDTIADIEDNCPNTVNPDQVDTIPDPNDPNYVVNPRIDPSLGNACGDYDEDGVSDEVDQCPYTSGPQQFSGCPQDDDDTPDGPALSSQPLAFYNTNIPITALEWDLTGEFLVTGNTLGEVCLWQISSSENFYDQPLQLGQCITSHNGRVNSVSWSPSGQALFVTTGDDGRIVIWRISDSDNFEFGEVQSLTSHNGPVYEVEWLNDGTEFISTGDDGKIFLWNASTGALLDNIPINGPRQIVFDPNSSAFASLENSGVLRYIDLAIRRGDEGYTGRIIDSDLDSSVDLDWAENGDLAVLGGDNVLRVYNAADLLQTSCSGSDPTRCSYHRVMQNLVNPRSVMFIDELGLLAISSNGRITTVDAETYVVNVIYSLQEEQSAINFEAMNFNPVHNLLAASDEQGYLYVWEIADGTVQRLNRTSTVRPTGRSLTTFAWSPNSNTVMVVDDQNFATLVNIDNQDVSEPYRVSNASTASMDWQVSNNQLIAFASCNTSDPQVTFWDIEPSTSVLSNETAQGGLTFDDNYLVDCITNVEFHPTLRYIAAGDNLGNVKILFWDENLVSSESSFILDSDDMNLQINDLEWNHDGTRLAGVSETGLLYVWPFNEEELGIPFSRQPHPSEPLTSLAWSQSSLVAVGSSEGWIAIYDTQDQSQVANPFLDAYFLIDSTDSIQSLSWSQDGVWLASVDVQGKLIIWRARTGAKWAEFETGITNGRNIDIEWNPNSPVEDVYELAMAGADGQVQVFEFRP